MRTRYALAALALFAAPIAAEAQNDQLQRWPSLTVTSPESVAGEFYNYVDLENLPGSYTAPDTTGGGLLVGYSVFFDVNTAGDTLDLAPIYTNDVGTPGSVSGEIALVDPILGCDPDAEGDPSVINNPDDLDGKIAVVMRGGCSFSTKAAGPFAAGAIGVIVWVPENDTYPAGTPAPGMLGTPAAHYEFFGIEPFPGPAISVPNGIGQVIADELDFGETIEATIGCAPVDPAGNAQDCGSLAQNPPTPVAPELAIEDIVLGEGTTAMKAYPNPTNGFARVALATATPEVVRVEVYNTLGQRVAVLHDGMVTGQVDLDLDASQFATGLYLVRATGETFYQTTRVTVAR